jgi:hypothetical protein
MVRTGIYILLGILLSIVESAALCFFPIEFFKPDLGMPLILYSALFLEPSTGLLVTLFVSISQEVFSSAPHGTILFTKFAIFLGTVLLKRQAVIESRYIFAGICAALVAAESVLYLFLSILARGDTNNILNVAYYTIPNAVLTGFFAITIMALVETINTRLLARHP